MRLIKNLLALIVLATGVLWSLQGIGLIGGSFMTGQSQWLYVGIVTALVGRAGLGEPLAWLSRRRSSGIGRSSTQRTVAARSPRPVLPAPVETFVARR
ncbi:hypothetical protein [Mesorhizobium sp. M0590]|uniref:hypothetical protein n=1 Tax=unclassified Mesorhizobium TaxID=325217 RepID=UPI003337DF15